MGMPFVRLVYHKLSVLGREASFPNRRFWAKMSGLIAAVLDRRAGLPMGRGGGDGASAAAARMSG